MAEGEKREKGTRLGIGDNKEGKKGHRFSEDWEKRRRTRWQMCQTTRSQGRRTLGHPGEQEDAWRSQTTLVFEGGSKISTLEAVQCPSK